MKLNLKLIIGAVLSFLTVTNVQAGKDPRPNILLITVDDMNWNSVGVYGQELDNITPNIDKLAAEGKRFQYAYVQSPNCSPSRGVIQTGKYPHSSGMRGFYYVDYKDMTLQSVLSDHGYFTAVLNKATDTSLSPKMENAWDFKGKFKKDGKRNPLNYSSTFEEILKASDNSGKPFYCVVNIADPHKLFYNDPGTKKEGYVDPTPSKLYKNSEVTIPDFLPNHPKIKQEVTNYYNSVKRADDCMGAVMSVLEEKGKKENTIVIFLSDHGMALPFAKSSCYENGVRTPFIVSWPGNIKANSVVKDQLVSAVDVMPTLLEILGIDEPDYLQGRSFKTILDGKKDKGRSEYVFTEFNENAGGIARPIRGVLSSKYNYVFNPWSTGEIEFVSAAMYHTSYKVMANILSKNDPAVKERVNYLKYRRVEEFYDLEKDPDALHNLIDDPQYQEEINKMRNALEGWMKETGDYTLFAFQNRNNNDALKSFMKEEEAQAKQRATTLKWKRYKNSEGPTKKRTKLYTISSK
ncbi:sulfatase family protein [Flammeovirga agarivorans]|uniref:Sulfatase n=1 Tax=Flammeovirga agarivorans TaxID=2726742 RepID=A0A7X8SK59_9BACT|nr:sulfatase [Flammeovirga agarivorans]NLR91721.1 sulfatase [Flammeovirga agarivorans]